MIVMEKMMMMMMMEIMMVMMMSLTMVVALSKNGVENENIMRQSQLR